MLFYEPFGIGIIEPIFGIFNSSIYDSPIEKIDELNEVEYNYYYNIIDNQINTNNKVILTKLINKIFKWSSIGYKIFELSLNYYKFNVHFYEKQQRKPITLVVG